MALKLAIHLEADIRQIAAWWGETTDSGHDFGDGVGHRVVLDLRLVNPFTQIGCLTNGMRTG